MPALCKRGQRPLSQRRTSLTGPASRRRASTFPSSISSCSVRRAGHRLRHVGLMLLPPQRSRRLRLLAGSATTAARPRRCSLLLAPRMAVDMARRSCCPLVATIFPCFCAAIDVFVGGWTGSTYFSQIMTPASQGAFVQACVDAVNTYNLDGQCPLPCDIQIPF